MKRLGIIGGMSWESTAVYYRYLNQQVKDAKGPLNSAPLLAGDALAENSAPEDANDGLALYSAPAEDSHPGGDCAAASER